MCKKDVSKEGEGRFRGGRKEEVGITNVAKISYLPFPFRGSRFTTYDCRFMFAVSRFTASGCRFTSADCRFMAADRRHNEI
jgi:hypothetical protein